MRETPNTRNALLAATRAAIAEGGLGTVTARGIAGRAKANLASIGYHFGSKDALVAEALMTDVRELIAPVLALLDGADHPEERAARAIAVLNELLVESGERIPVYLAAVSVAPHDDDVRTALAAMVVEARDHLTANIQDQAASGRLAPWVDPSAMAALIVAVVQGVVVSAALETDDPGAVGPQAIAAQFMSLLLAARVPE